MDKSNTTAAPNDDVNPYCKGHRDNLQGIIATAFALGQANPDGSLDSPSLLTANHAAMRALASYIYNSNDDLLQAINDTSHLLWQACINAEVKKEIGESIWLIVSTLEKFSRMVQNANELRVDLHFGLEVQGQPTNEPFLLQFSRGESR